MRVGREKKHICVRTKVHLRIILKERERENWIAVPWLICRRESATRSPAVCVSPSRARAHLQHDGSSSGGGSGGVILLKVKCHTHRDSRRAQRQQRRAISIMRFCIPVPEVARDSSVISAACEITHANNCLCCSFWAAGAFYYEFFTPLCQQFCSKLLEFWQYIFKWRGPRCFRNVVEDWLKVVYF